MKIPKLYRVDRESTRHEFGYVVATSEREACELFDRLPGSQVFVDGDTIKSTPRQATCAEIARHESGLSPTSQEAAAFYLERISLPLSEPNDQTYEHQN